MEGIEPVQFADLLDRVRALGDGRVIVGISGFGGSGKSTLAGVLAHRLPAAAIAPVDCFHTDQVLERSSDWSNIDWDRLRSQVLQPFRAGTRVRFQAYEWDTRRLGRWIEVADVQCLIVEGVGLLRPDVMPLLDYSVWVDCPPEVATARAIIRDRAQGEGPENDELWRTVWTPNSVDFYDRFRPHEHADFVYLNP